MNALRANHRVLPALLVVIATQVSGACTTGMHAGSGPGSAAPAATPAPDTARPALAATSPPVAAKPAPAAPKAEREAARPAPAVSSAAPISAHGGGDKETPVAKSAPEPNDCISAKCHTTILGKANVHDAAEGCTDCHEEVSSPHPAKGVKTFKLLNDMPDLCYTCHDEHGKKKTVHSPVADGACTDCHDPHSTAEPALLIKPVGELCLSCHDTIADTIQHAKVSHDALDDDKGCLLCHSPHASDNEALLEKPTREVCLDCHDATIPTDAKVLHGKNHDGDCAACHEPHGGDIASLLVAEFPEGNYQHYTSKAYPLCFGCHDREMVEQAQSSRATGFRDGSKNLHFVHVNDSEKSRSCSMCHVVHGGDNPKLIQDSIAFGQWKMQLKFVKTETGGGCAPGCHKPLYYDRDSPGRKPAASRPTGASGG